MASEYRVQQKSMDDVLKLADQNDIPNLPTTVAHHPTVSMHMMMISSMVSMCNEQKVSTIPLERLCMEVLLSGEMYYAEASKFDVCVIVAKCRQMRGENIQEAFMEVVRKCYNEYKIGNEGEKEA